MFLWGHRVVQLVGESVGMCFDTNSSAYRCSFIPKGHTCWKYFEEFVFISRSLGAYYCTTYYCLKKYRLRRYHNRESNIECTPSSVASLTLSEPTDPYVVVAAKLQGEQQYVVVYKKDNRQKYQTSTMLNGLSFAGLFSPELCWPFNVSCQNVNVTVPI